MVIYPHSSPPDVESSDEIWSRGEDPQNTAPRPWYRRARYLLPLAAVAAAVAAVVAVNTSPGRDTDTAPSNPYDAAFGTFQPVTISGSGTAKVSLPSALSAQARGGIITIDYNGSGRFEMFIENGPPLARSTSGMLDIGYLSRRGPYNGTILFGNAFVPGGRSGPPAAHQSWRLSVLSPDSKASWKATIAPISSAKELPALASGAGDGVFLHSGGFARLHFRHRPPGGTDSFSIWQWDLDRLAGTWPRMSGSYVFPGPAVVAVSSAGRWSATLE